MVIKISRRERDIILGTILGDGHLAMLKSDARLEINHSEKQKSYVFWMHKELKRLVSAKPHRIVIKDQRFKEKTYVQYRFKTMVSSVLTQYHCLFYREGKKVVPSRIVEILKSPLSLAVWFMDDGGRRNDCYGLFLNTLSFTKAEHLLLQECLMKNYSIDSNLHWIQDGYRLYIPSKYAQAFCEMVYPHVIPCMRYKLPYNPVTTSFARLDRARDRQST